jgi:hypothetical protein
MLCFFTMRYREVKGHLPFVKTRKDSAGPQSESPDTRRQEVTVGGDKLM